MEIVSHPALDECRVDVRWRYTYDKAGRKRLAEKHMTEGIRLQERISYSYDAAGRLATKEWLGGDDAVDIREWYTYDGDGRLSARYRRDWNGGEQVSFGYDLAGRLVREDHDRLVDGSIDEVHYFKYVDDTSTRRAHACDGCEILGDADGIVDMNCDYVNLEEGRLVVVECDGGVWDLDGNADGRTTYMRDRYGNPLSVSFDGETSFLEPHVADGTTDETWLYDYGCWE